MTPERALLERMRDRLEAAANERCSVATSPLYALGRRNDAEDHLAWLTAEMAKLEGER